jgi:DNA-binding response OmpR family regulator/class 3 adenylate cyclase
VKNRVLIVVEEIDVRARIARVLHRTGYAVELASNAKRALKLVSDQQISAAIVGLGSGLASLAIAQELRDAVPKLLVLADTSEDMTRLDRSFPEVDAVFLKSSSEEELVGKLAEMIAVSARTGDDAAPRPTILWIENCKFDLAARVFIDAEGRELHLTRAEYAVLKDLANSPGEVLSRNQLRQAFIGRGADPFDRSIDMLVARLRHKIEPDPKNPRFIITVPGAEYKLVDQRKNGGRQRSGAEPIRPERRHLTVLSCNLLDATALAARFGPEDLAKAVRDFQDSCAAVVTRMGGRIMTHRADEVVALFGYSEAHEDDAERAVHAGLRLVDIFAQLRSPPNQPPQVQIGVAAGWVVVARGLLVVGEPIGIAAGLCELAPPNSVLVAESTCKLLNTVFAYQAPTLYRLARASQAVNACVCMVYDRFRSPRGA